MHFLTAGLYDPFGKLSRESQRKGAFPRTPDIALVGRGLSHCPLLGALRRADGFCAQGPFLGWGYLLVPSPGPVLGRTIRARPLPKLLPWKRIVGCLHNIDRAFYFLLTFFLPVCLPLDSVTFAIPAHRSCDTIAVSFSVAVPLWSSSITHATP